MPDSTPASPGALRWGCEPRGAAHTASTAVDDGALKDTTLIAFGTSAKTSSICDARSCVRSRLPGVLAADNSLVLRLGEEVAELVQTAQNSSDAAALRTQAIGNGQLLLLLITALSVVGAALIAVRYVVPGVVRQSRGSPRR